MSKLKTSMDVTDDPAGTTPIRRSSRLAKNPAPTNSPQMLTRRRTSSDSNSSRSTPTKRARQNSSADEKQPGDDLVEVSRTKRMTRSMSKSPVRKGKSVSPESKRDEAAQTAKKITTENVLVLEKTENTTEEKENLPHNLNNEEIRTPIKGISVKKKVNEKVDGDDVTKTKVEEKKRNLSIVDEEDESIQSSPFVKKAVETVKMITDKGVNLEVDKSSAENVEECTSQVSLLELQRGESGARDNDKEVEANTVVVSKELYTLNKAYKNLEESNISAKSIAENCTTKTETSMKQTISPKDKKTGNMEHCKDASENQEVTLGNGLNATETLDKTNLESRLNTDEVLAAVAVDDQCTLSGNTPEGIVVNKEDTSNSKETNMRKLSEVLNQLGETDTKDHAVVSDAGLSESEDELIDDLSKVVGEATEESSVDWHEGRSDIEKYPSILKLPSAEETPEEQTASIIDDLESMDSSLHDKTASDILLCDESKTFETSEPVDNAEVDSKKQPENLECTNDKISPSRHEKKAKIDGYMSLVTDCNNSDTSDEFALHISEDEEAQSVHDIINGENSDSETAKERSENSNSETAKERSENEIPCQEVGAEVPTVPVTENLETEMEKDHNKSISENSCNISDKIEIGTENYEKISEIEEKEDREVVEETEKGDVEQSINDSCGEQNNSLVEKQSGITPDDHPINDSFVEQVHRSVGKENDISPDSFVKENEDSDTRNSYEEGDSEGASNEFIDDMASEGTEKTPSVDSNEIIDEGESVGSTERESLDESYERDSFVVSDDEEIEDVMLVPKKKRLRIISVDSSDSDVLFVNDLENKHPSETVDKNASDKSGREPDRVASDRSTDSAVQDINEDSREPEGAPHEKRISSQASNVMSENNVMQTETREMVDRDMQTDAIAFEYVKECYKTFINTKKRKRKNKSREMEIPDIEISESPEENRTGTSYPHPTFTVNKSPEGDVTALSDSDEHDESVFESDLSTTFEAAASLSSIQSASVQVPGTSYSSKFQQYLSSSQERAVGTKKEKRKNKPRKMKIPDIEISESPEESRTGTSYRHSTFTVNECPETDVTVLYDSDEYDDSVFESDLSSTLETAAPRSASVQLPGTSNSSKFQQYLSSKRKCAGLSAPPVSTGSSGFVVKTLKEITSDIACRKGWVVHEVLNQPCPVVTQKIKKLKSDHGKKVVKNPYSSLSSFKDKTLYGPRVKRMPTKTLIRLKKKHGLELI